jgi:hypothetical protein
VWATVSSSELLIGCAGAQIGAAAEVAAAAAAAGGDDTADDLPAEEAVPVGAGFQSSLYLFPVKHLLPNHCV